MTMLNVFINNIFRSRDYLYTTFLGILYKLSDVDIISGTKQ